MPELRERHQREKAEGGDDVEPPEAPVDVERGRVAQAAHDLRHNPARGRPVRPTLVASGDFVPADAQPLNDDAREEHDAEETDDHRVFRLAPVPGELGGRLQVSAVDRHRDTEQAHEAQDVANEAVAEVNGPPEESVLAAALPEDQGQVVVYGED